MWKVFGKKGVALVWVAMLILSIGGCISEVERSEQFGFVHGWGSHSYNSFTQTYSRSLCKDDLIHNVQIDLGRPFIEKIRADLKRANFLSLDTDVLATYGAYPEDGQIIDLMDRVVVMNESEGAAVNLFANCGGSRLFAQFGTSSNYVWRGCAGVVPKESGEAGRIVYRVGEYIEETIAESDEYKAAPESECVYL